MPTDACLRFCECKGGESLLEPKQGGDCCVIYSQGDTLCPLIQGERENMVNTRDADLA
ncbi:GDCCVxC domain-containing (seleno)protein [Methylosinus sp. PW1]|uniref:GDCCVxC domain-containing (seleno)protein n=1 Tax=Methylosinus sp. PW1 TaxID=107636 RepID=UPI002737A29B|nr:GDCCVxC domain-containing (seleno)protein [Methylosinus sp. PW1]